MVLKTFLRSCFGREFLKDIHLRAHLFLLFFVFDMMFTLGFEERHLSKPGMPDMFFNKKYKHIMLQNLSVNITTHRDVNITNKNVVLL